MVGRPVWFRNAIHNQIHSTSDQLLIIWNPNVFGILTPNLFGARYSDDCYNHLNFWPVFGSYPEYHLNTGLVFNSVRTYHFIWISENDLCLLRNGVITGLVQYSNGKNQSLSWTCSYLMVPLTKSCPICITLSTFFAPNKLGV